MVGTMRKLKSIPGGRAGGQAAVQSAIRTLDLESGGLGALRAALDNGLARPFTDAVGLIKAARGRVIVSGIGKSGHVGQKIAATFASTGTPAFFVHPSEASHGDLGMITPDDVVVMLSNSGETDELVMLAPHLRREGARLIAITGNEQSSLAQAADVHLDAAVDAEACPLGLAPTASTTAAISPDAAAPRSERAAPRTTGPTVMAISPPNLKEEASSLSTASWVLINMSTSAASPPISSPKLKDPMP